jgi:hypothetical protein
MNDLASLLKEFASNNPQVQKKAEEFHDAIQKAIEVKDITKNFKEIDIAFLTMRSAKAIARPAFAILPYNLYLKKRICKWNKGYFWDNKTHFGDMFSDGDKRENSALIAYPRFEVPVRIKQKADATKGIFDEQFVAWEAEWVEEAPSDPLLIGQLGDKYYLIDAWDATKLESYITQEFTK